MALVTVTCDRDINIACLQAHSINKFLEDTHTHYIIIESSKKSIQEWEDLFRPLYTTHNLRLVEAKELILINHLPGYIRQQVLKFTISEIISSQSYLLLDSKDILLKKTKLHEWGSQEGNDLIYKPYKKSNRIQEILAPELKVYANFATLCQKVIGATPPQWFWAPSTPFRCKTDNVRTVLRSVDVNRLFDPYITGIKEVSEFILYRFFSDSTIDLSIINENYWTNGNNTKFMWPNQDIDNDVSIIKDDFYKSVSFHRWYISNNAKRIDKIKKVLTEDIGLDYNLVEKSFDPTYWTEQTRHERGQPVFDQFNFGFRFE